MHSNLNLGNCKTCGQPLLGEVCDNCGALAQNSQSIAPNPNGATEGFSQQNREAFLETFPSQASTHLEQPPVEFSSVYSGQQAQCSPQSPYSRQPSVHGQSEYSPLPPYQEPLSAPTYPPNPYTKRSGGYVILALILVILVLLAVIISQLVGDILKAKKSTGAATSIAVTAASNGETSSLVPVETVAS